MAINFIDKDMGMKEFLRQARMMEGKSYTKVGLPMEETPPSIPDKINAKGNKSLKELVRIAAIHEWGAPNAGIPERSFIRATVDKEKENINKLLKANIKAHEENFLAMPFKNVLGQVGEYVTNSIQNAIRNRLQPELKDATVRRKTVGGKTGDVPLIDTGQLIQSITHVEKINKKEKSRF